MRRRTGSRGSSGLVTTIAGTQTSAAVLYSAPGTITASAGSSSEVKPTWAKSSVSSRTPTSAPCRSISGRCRRSLSRSLIAQWVRVSVSRPRTRRELISWATVSIGTSLPGAGASPVPA